jgi:protein arginine N-methyltransferase 5
VFAVRSKYFLYYAAILQACQTLLCSRVTNEAETGICQRPQSASRSLRILVLGAGHGRLVTLALAAAREASGGELPIMIEALDANPQAIIFLRKHFCNQPEVTVHDPICINGPLSGPSENEAGEKIQGLADKLTTASSSVAGLERRCDLIVSEVFGSFGDNEFLPEIAAEAAAFFASPRALCIPCSYQ